MAKGDGVAYGDYFHHSAMSLTVIRGVCLFIPFSLVLGSVFLSTATLWHRMAFWGLCGSLLAFQRHLGYLYLDLA
jgi:uncharacterized membrane protein